MVSSLLDKRGTIVAALHSPVPATEGYVVHPTLRGLMQTPSVGNFHREASSSNTSEERQFARFLDAANELGGNLGTIFADGFAKILANAPQTKQPGASLPPEIASSGIVTRIEQGKRENSLRENQPSAPSLEIESSLVVRLHFAEAMMVLMFNALSEPQQLSIKRHFDDLLKRAENVEVFGVPPSTFQRYRDTLRAMGDMLASNPTPEAMAAPLAHDFARRHSARPKGGDGATPPPAG
jgi:hypothetical protein